MIDKRIEPGEFALPGPATPDEDLNSADALLRKADALLSRHRGGDDTPASWQPADDDDLPLLTDVVAVETLPDPLPGPHPTPFPNPLLNPFPGPQPDPYTAPTGVATGGATPPAAPLFFGEARFDLPEPHREPVSATWPPPSDPPLAPWPSTTFAPPPAVSTPDAFPPATPFDELPVPPASGLSWDRDALEPFIGGAPAEHPASPASGHGGMLAPLFDALDLSGFPPDPFLEPPPSFLSPAPLPVPEPDTALALDDADLSWPLDENLAPLDAHAPAHDELSSPPQVFRDTPRGERGLTLDFVLPPEPTPRAQTPPITPPLATPSDYAVIEALAPSAPVPDSTALVAEAPVPEATEPPPVPAAVPPSGSAPEDTEPPTPSVPSEPVAAAAAPDSNHLIERLVGLDTEIKRLIEDWFAEELPPIVQRELDRLAERIRTEALGQLRATLLPRLSEHVARQLSEPE